MVEAFGIGALAGFVVVILALVGTSIYMEIQTRRGDQSKKDE